MNRSVGRALWLAATPVRLVLLGLIRLYQLTLSGLIGGHCRFHPSCSEYAVLAIRGHGVIRGIGLALWRVARCSPLSPGGVDYPPAGRHGPTGPSRSAPRYEAVIHQGETARPGLAR